MNLLEHYIKEIISVEPYDPEWCKEKNMELLKIVAVTDCYGAIETKMTVEKPDEWEKIKARGYFMM